MTACDSTCTENTFIVLWYQQAVALRAYMAFIPTTVDRPELLRKLIATVWGQAIL